jgi:hypothetical protein
MKVVTGVILGREPIGMRRITHRAIEIDDPVEIARRPDERVDCLAVGLRGWVG